MISHGLGDPGGGGMIVKNTLPSGVMIVKTGGGMILKDPALDGVMILKDHRSPTTSNTMEGPHGRSAPRATASREYRGYGRQHTLREARRDGNQCHLDLDDGSTWRVFPQHVPVVIRRPPFSVITPVRNDLPVAEFDHILRSAEAEDEVFVCFVDWNPPVSSTLT